jgi:hypothetical protein
MGGINIAMQVSVTIHDAGNTPGLFHYEFISEVSTVTASVV